MDMQGKLSKKVNYKDIARLAEVSPATVSRALNQRNIVKPDTLNRVLAAMHTLGYQTSPSYTPKNAAKIILVFIPCIGRRFHLDVLNGIKSAASLNGYTVLVSDDILQDQNICHLISLVDHQHISGLIVSGEVLVSVYKRIRGLIPIVQCCDYCEEVDISYVACDDFKAVSRLMQYIFALGCKKIAFINGDTTRLTHARLRLEAYTESMKEAGNPINPNWVVQLSEVNGKLPISAALSILQNREDLPDCIVCTSDDIAAALLKVCNGLNIRVPQDVMVTGFDNIEISTLSSPTLTSVNQPRYEIGYTACSYLLEQIANPAAPIQRTYLDTELIIRESTTGF